MCTLGVLGLSCETQRAPDNENTGKMFCVFCFVFFVLFSLVDLVSLNVCQHCSCTSVHILCTPANVVTSALAQVFSKTVIHGIESQQSNNKVAEQWLALNKPMRLLPRCGSLRRSKNFRALRMSQSSGEEKLNFRHAERHMPGMFNGKATEYTEYIFKMEAYMSTLDPAGKGGEILRAAATEVKDILNQVRVSLQRHISAHQFSSNRFSRTFPKVCNCFCRATTQKSSPWQISIDCRRKLGTRFRLSWNSLSTHLTMCLPRLTHAFRTCFCKVWPTCQLAHVLQVEMCKSTCELHKTPPSLHPHPENETEKTRKKSRTK